MMTFALLVAWMAQAPAVPANRPLPPGAHLPMLMGVTYSTDGDRGGPVATLESSDESHWFVYFESGVSGGRGGSGGGGSTAGMCRTMIGRTIPRTAVFGWEVHATPAGTIAPNPVGIQVTWQRLGEGGVRKDGPKQTAQLSLGAGRSVLLDYVSTAPTNTCNAVGTGFVISGPIALATTTIGTDLWLVHRFPDGSEHTQRQTVRSRLAGSGADYYFDDIKVFTPRGEVIVEILGRVVPYAKVEGPEGDRLRITVEIQRRYTTTSPLIDWKTRSGSSTNNIDATPGEVLSFNLPPLADDGVLVGHRFSLRLQPTQVRPGA